MGADSWEIQYDLSLRLHEAAVLSHFSSQHGNRDQLKKRIDAVFEHAKDFSDKFKTHCVWIKLLSITDLSRAIEESLNALEILGEPLDTADIDYNVVSDELSKLKEQFSGKRDKKFLSTNRLTECNKARAMKVMSSLSYYYHQRKSCLGAYVACQMMKITMTYGHCEYSAFGAAAFAAALVNTLDDIDEGSAWGRSTLSLMNLYDKEALMSSIYGLLYGVVFIWKGEHRHFGFWIPFDITHSRDAQFYSFIHKRALPITTGAFGTKHPIIICKGRDRIRGHKYCKVRG